MAHHFSEIVVIIFPGENKHLDEGKTRSLTTRTQQVNYTAGRELQRIKPVEIVGPLLCEKNALNNYIIKTLSQKKQVRKFESSRSGPTICQSSRSGIGAC